MQNKLRKTIHTFPTTNLKMSARWGDDDDEYDAVQQEPETQAPEPAPRGLRCQNPLCTTVFPVVNPGCFESRIMTFVRDATRRRDPRTGEFDIVNYYCPSAATGRSRAAEAIARLRANQACIDKKDSRFQVLEQRIQNVTKRLARFFSTEHDCYAEARRAELKFIEYSKTGVEDLAEYTPDKAYRFKILAKAANAKATAHVIFV